MARFGRWALIGFALAALVGGPAGARGGQDSQARAEGSGAEVKLGGRNKGVAGAPLLLAWVGENTDPDDVITIVPRDAGPGARGPSVRVGDRSKREVDTPREPGKYEARYIAAESGEILARYPVRLEAPEVELEAPSRVPRGTNFEIWWGKPVQRHDVVTLVPADAPPDARGEFVFVGDNERVTFHAPDEAGTYEVRYVLQGFDEPAARTTIEVVEQTLSLTAPAKVPGGGSISVEWSQVLDPRDSITVVPAEAPADQLGDRVRAGRGGAGVLQAPAEPGDYEIRYVPSSGGVALAREPIKITPPRVSVSGPASAIAGAAIEASWGDPIHPRDYVTIVPTRAPADAHRERVRVGTESSATVPAPTEPGEYELRYVLEQSGEAIAATPLPVASADTSVSAPASVDVGERFEVRWSDAINPRDYVTIVPATAAPDARGDRQGVGTGVGGYLEAPQQPGRYEVRYVMHESGMAIASTPVDVVGGDTSLSAPARVMAGAGFEVGWSRAYHPDDTVVIARPGAPDAEPSDSARVGDGDAASLTAPGEPGRYELRYMPRNGIEAVATAQVEVVPAETDISGPGRVTGGKRFTVAWSRAIHPRDYVNLVPADAGPHAFGETVRVGSGEQASLTAPGKGGEYELRYVLQVNGAIVARSPLQVVAPEVGISAPGSVTAGAPFTVSWERAINPRDRVTVVRADAGAAAYDRYLRVGERDAGELDAPGEPGDYEVRYLLEANGRAIARQPITVTEPDVSISAPEAVAPGSRFEVNWSNAVHPRDMVTVVPVGTASGKYAEYIRVGHGDSCELPAPAQPGAYEVRYLLNATGEAVARTGIRVE